MMEHARHLDSDIAGTHQSSLFGLFLKFEEAIGTNTELTARCTRGKIRMPPSGQKDLFGPDSLFVAVV